jgi:REP element-mobilizing transposase RayT
MLFSQRVNEYLDSGVGCCILKEEKISQIVADSLKHFDGTRYALGEWVIMPNHVHIIIQPFPEYDLSNIMKSIKSYCAHLINKTIGASGSVWQDESFDHIIRTVKQKNRIEQYIADNPKMAKLKSGYKCSSKQCSTGVPPV